MAEWKDFSMKNDRREMTCDRCNQHTIHRVVFSSTERRIVPLRPPLSMWTEITERYQVVRCEKCGTVRLIVGTGDDQIEQEIIYPASIARKTPEWVALLPENLSVLADEVYAAVNAGLYRVAAMGVRSLVEAFLVHQGGTAGPFAEKLRMLVEKRTISAPQSDILAAVLEFGHAAVHREFVPSIDQIMGLMDIVEPLLHQWVAARAVPDVLKDVPPRQR